MSHRTIDQVPQEAPQMEQILEAVLLQALEIAKEKLEAGELLVPFTALAVGETLFLETHPAEEADDCFKMARHTVQNASGALAYAFCYDGYVDTDQGELDAIIAEGGVPKADSGHAVGFLYTVEGEGENLKFKIEEEPLYIGQAPNFMAFTPDITWDEDEEEGKAEELEEKHEGDDDRDDDDKVEEREDDDDDRDDDDSEDENDD